MAAQQATEGPIVGLLALATGQTSYFDCRAQTEVEAIAVPLADHLGVAVEPLAAALGRAHASSVGRYRSDLSAEQLAEVEHERSEEPDA